MKIMLIDDSKVMRNIQKNILAQMGHTDIVEATDGNDALAKLAGLQPELFLVDWNMPNMDGLTFIKTLRGQGNKSAIIMVTTEAERSRIIDAIKAGANNYVVKPFTPEVLSERIKETLARVAA